MVGDWKRILDKFHDFSDRIESFKVLERFIEERDEEILKGISKRLINKFPVTPIRSIIELFSTLKIQRLILPQIVLINHMEQFVPSIVLLNYQNPY